MNKDRVIPAWDIAQIAKMEGDRWYIRKTLVACIGIPQPYPQERKWIEIIALKPGSFAITATTPARLIFNIGVNWPISYHIRTYKDAR